MSIGKDGKLFSTLSDPIYAEGKLVKEIWINNNGIPTKIYPIGAVSQDYWWYITSYGTDSYEYHVVDSQSKIPAGVVGSDVLPAAGYAINRAEATATGQPMDNRTALNSMSRPVTSNIKRIYIDDKVSPSSIALWFAGFSNTLMHWYGLENLDISNCTSFKYAFGSCAMSDGLTQWLATLDVSKVKDFTRTFFGFGNAYVSSTSGMDSTFLNAIKNWNVSGAENMSYMFGSAYVGDNDFFGYLSAWDVSKVKDFSYMFNNLQKGGRKTTDTLDIGKLATWKPSSAENFAYMFYRSNTTMKTVCAYDLSGGYLWSDPGTTNTYEYYYSDGLELKKFHSGADSNNDWGLYIPETTKQNNAAFRSMFPRLSSSVYLDNYNPAWFYNTNQYTNDKYSPDYDSARAQLN